MFANHEHDVIEVLLKSRQICYPQTLGRAVVEALSGDRVNAKKDLDELSKLHEKHLLADSSLAFVYAGLGDKGSAWLASAVEERSCSLIEINNDNCSMGCAPTRALWISSVR